MPIINSKHPRNPVWEHVSFPMSLELIPESNQVGREGGMCAAAQALQQGGMCARYTADSKGMSCCGGLRTELHA